MKKILETIIIIASISLLLWAFLVASFSGQRETTGVVNNIYVEDGVTKIEVLAESGKKEIYEYSGKTAVVEKDKVKLKFFKPLFLTPKILEITK